MSLPVPKRVHRTRISKARCAAAYALAAAVPELVRTLNEGQDVQLIVPSKVLFEFVKAFSPR